MYKSDILLTASELSLGENTRVLCPSCRGGKSGELSLSITLCEDGVVRWQCFRAKCDLSGTTGQSTQPQQIALPVEQKPRKIWDGVVQPLREYETQWILKNWYIEDPPYWWYTPEMGGRVAMSIRSPKYIHRGWCLRDITGTARTKALTFVEPEEESLSWYKVNVDAPTVVVEDIPSAVRVSMCGVNAVALLGTRMGDDRAIEIAENAKHVIVALDNDAVDLSFRHAHNYGLLWDSVQVLPLKKDFKNMTETEIKEILQ